MRQEDFERLYAEHAQALFAFLAYRTGDRILAEDLLADTFERVFRTRRGFDRRRGGEKAWLYTIALNLVRDHARRQAAETRALAREAARSEPRAPITLSDVEDRDEALRLLERLSSEEREALALRYGADLTVPEIARLTKEPITTIEGRIYRSLRKLRSRLPT